jgi:hypothetical protein
MILKLKIWFKNRFYKKLSKQDLLGYRNLLKIIYHKNAEHPTLDINKDNSVKRYFIDIKSLKMTLIIDDNFAEIVNSSRIWPLNLDNEVYKRATKRIYELKCKQIQEREQLIKNKKQTILEDLYSQIK